MWVEKKEHDIKYQIQKSWPLGKNHKLIQSNS